MNDPRWDRLLANARAVDQAAPDMPPGLADRVVALWARGAASPRQERWPLIVALATVAAALLIALGNWADLRAALDDRPAFVFPTRVHGFSENLP